MREKIKRFANENFEYELPEIILSQEKIELSVVSGSIFRGTLTIENQAGVDMRGVVYSNDRFLRVVNPMFIGAHSSIQYTFIAKTMEPGECFAGALYVVSSCGEVSIPVTVSVVKPYFESSVGTIADLFHFSNLAQINWNEAAGFFETEEFEAALLKKEGICNVYRSLKKSYSSSIALEEFLLAIQKKLPLGIRLEKENLVYEECKENFVDKVVLIKDSWGYEEFSIGITGDFLSTEKKVITTEDFFASQCEVEFLVDYSQLGAGINFGKIVFTSALREITAWIQVEMEPLHEGKIQRRKRKEDTLFAIQNYLNLRTNQISHDKYCQELDLLLKHSKAYSSDFEHQMLEAHYYIMDRQAAAEPVLQTLEQNLETLKKDWIIGYCGYYYLKACYTKSPQDVEEALAKIWAVYEEEESNWQVFWFILYLDEQYMDEPKRKWKKLMTFLEAGVTSPVLYYEVCHMVGENIECLKTLPANALRALNWGIKMNFLSKEAMDVYCLLALKEEGAFKTTIKNLEAIYAKNPGRDVLATILKMIIRAQDKNPRYFKWFALGEAEKLKIENLYEYYLDTAGENFEEKIPSSVLMFFLYDNELGWKKKAYLYAYIVKNKVRDMGTYISYDKMMRKFTMEQVRAGRINTNLAVLYEEYISQSSVEEGIAIGLSKVLFCHEVICWNPKITGVYVKHKELETENYASFTNGRAYVDISTENAVLTFEDRRGNRYLGSIEYSVKRLLHIPGLTQACYQYCKTNSLMILNLFEGIDHYQKQDEDSISIQRRCVLMPHFSGYYKGRCYERLIEHYYNAMEQEALEEMLRVVELKTLSKKYRGRVLEYSIIHDLRDKVKAGLMEYGFGHISVKRLFMFCSDEIKQSEAQEKNGFLLDLSYHVFCGEKYDEQILGYLECYYNGDTKSMMKLWKSVKDFEIETYQLEERILSQALFAESRVRRAYEIFLSYYEKRGNERLIQAFLKYNAYKYLVKDRILKEDIFRVMLKELSYEECTMNRLAVLKYLSEIQGLTKEELDFCERSIWKLWERNVVLPFFKKFEGSITLPREITNYYYAEYKCNPDKQVKIHYCLESDLEGGEYITEIMENVYMGIHIKTFLLFQDEYLVYYISENDEEKAVITQSVKAEMENNPEADDSMFGLINLMITAKEMQDEKTLVELMEYFVKLKYSSEVLFDIL